jgi:hypothetical protein
VIGLVIEIATVFAIECIDHVIIIKLMDTLIISDFNTSSNVNVTKQIDVAKKKKKKTALSVKLAIVFVAALAIGLIAWTPWKSSVYDEYKISNEAIVEQLAKAPQEDFQIAATHFKNGDYYETRQIVSKYYFKNLGDARIAKQYAAILIANDCFETSKQVLYPVFGSKNQQDRAEAAYLLGLTFLKEGNNVAGKQWLMKVPNGSVQYRQAQEIITKLEAL